MGIDPGTPGSCPGPKAGAKPLSHPGIPLFFFLIFYLFIHERHREREAKTQAEREKQASHREPDAGVNPRTLESRPEPKTDAQPLSHPGAKETGFDGTQ